MSYDIENQTIRYPLFSSEEMDEIMESLKHDPGYREIGTDIFVRDEDAYRYAIERISQDKDLMQEFKEMLVEWFYSGNWIKED